MLKLSNNFNEALASPVRRIDAKVELYNGSTLVNTFTQYDIIKKLTIDRVGDMDKFFGFVVVHRLNVHLIDIKKALEITTANSIKVYLGANGEFAEFPTFYVSEVHRDEKTGELSITAYDLLYKSAEHTVAELEVNAPYSPEQFYNAAATLLGSTIHVVDEDILGDSTVFYDSYENGFNVEGTETLRDMFVAIAEVTASIVYVNNLNEIVLKNLPDSDSLVIEPSNYISLKTSNNRRLTGICNTTELGNNTIAELAESGTIQYIRDNPLWNMREDIETLLDNILNAIGGLTINQFDCKWRGNPALEIGDKIKLIAPNGTEYYSFLLNDTIDYDGTLQQKTKWNYEGSDTETAANSNNLGAVAKQTAAFVDKANKEISMIASQVSGNSSAISSLLLTTDDIIATVTENKEVIDSSISGINEEIANLTNKVELAMTSEEVKISIQEELDNGVSSVVTEETGFTFNKDGLNISKDGSEISTTITEDGMKVEKNGNSVLIANNEGVEATDLRATTFLIIGENSRFENRGKRTVCLWIGG